MEALKSREVQRPAAVDQKLDETLASLMGGDNAPVSRALVVVSRLDDETASRLDRMVDIRIEPLAPLQVQPTVSELQLDAAGALLKETVA